MEIKELLERIRYLLNLPALATPDEIAAELQKAVDLVKGGAAAEVAANTLGVVGVMQAQSAQIVALSAAAPDPAKYVPVDAMAALQTEVAALRNEKVTREVDGVVIAALSAGKLLPPQEKWARDLGMSNLVALNQYLETAQPVAALSAMQNGGKPPAGGENEHGLNDSQLAACKQLGVSQEDYKLTLSGKFD